MLIPEIARNIVGIFDISWNYPLWRYLQLSWSKMCTPDYIPNKQRYEDVNICNTHSHYKVPKSPARTRILELKSPLAALRIIFTAITP